MIIKYKCSLYKVFFFIEYTGLGAGRGKSQADMHEAYQCLLKVIRAKNRFKAKTMEKMVMGEATQEVRDTVKRATKVFRKVVN